MCYHEAVKMNTPHLHTSTWRNFLKIIHERNKLQNHTLQFYEGQNTTMYTQYNVHTIHTHTHTHTKTKEKQRSDSSKIQDGGCFLSGLGGRALGPPKVLFLFFNDFYFFHYCLFIVFCQFYILFLKLDDGYLGIHSIIL